MINIFLIMSLCQLIIGYMSVIGFELTSRCILTIFFKHLKIAIFSRSARKQSRVKCYGKNGVIAAYLAVADIRHKLPRLAFQIMLSVMGYRYSSAVVMTLHAQSDNGLGMSGVIAVLHVMVV